MTLYGAGHEGASQPRWLTVPQSTLVSRDDLRRILRKIGRTGLPGSLERTVRSALDGQARVVEHWSEDSLPDGQWWDVPAVRRRWAQMVTGDPDLDFRQHVVRRYLSDGTSRRALSLGCGRGHREIAWARLGAFDELVGVDLAPAAVEAATAAARDAGISEAQLRFEVGNNDTLEWHSEAYDVVIFEHSLHHFTDVPGTLARVDRALRPGGLLVMDEYVGARKFQWSSRQVQAADSLLTLLPDAARRRANGRLKDPIRRPSLVAMRLDDPSEAVESDRIMPAVRRAFEVREDRGYGGALLHLVFSQIAQNFTGDDPQTRRLLEMCFLAEDALLAAGEIDHDFRAVVARKR